MSKCPECDADDSKVKETRFNDAGYWRARRRQCKQCECSFWTLEVPENYLAYHQGIERWILTDGQAINQ